MVSAAPSPYGRYLLPLTERILYVPLTAGYCVAVWLGFYTDHESVLPIWYKMILLAGVMLLALGAVPQWFVAATVISPDGIRRNFAMHRDIAWSDIADFRVSRSRGVKGVYAHLVTGGKRRLDGVPPKALPTLQSQVRTGIKTGTWWLVDYSVMESARDALGTAGSAGR
jgi:hypothetical protein